MKNMQDLENKMKKHQEKEEKERQKRVKAIESEAVYGKWLQETEERLARERMFKLQKKYAEAESKEKEKFDKEAKQVAANTRFLEWLHVRGFEPKATVHDRLCIHKTKQAKTQKYKFGRESNAQ